MNARIQRNPTSRRALTAIALWLALEGAVVSLVVGCDNSDMARTEPGQARYRGDRDQNENDDDDAEGSGTGAADGLPAQINSGTNTAVDAASQGGAIPAATTATATGASGVLVDATGGGGAPSTEPMEYPSLSFKGHGYTTYKQNDHHLDMDMNTETTTDPTSLVFNTSMAKVHCGDLDGCDQGKVDGDVNARSLGATRFTRVSKDQVRASLGEAGADATTWGIFVNAVVAKNGTTFTASSPFPNYPWPKPEAAFAGLAAPITYNVTFTADRYVSNDHDVNNEQLNNPTLGPILEGQGKAKKTFAATITVSRAAVGAGQVAVTFDLNLPDDRDHNLYENFPVPKRAIYTVDTVNKNIVAADVTTYANGDKSRDPEESRLVHRLCTKTLHGQTQSFSCP